VEGLRENCCAAFTGIIQALCRGGGDTERGKKLIRPHLNVVWHLVLQVASASNPASPDMLCASALALVGDVITAFGQEIVGVADTEQVRILFNRCLKSNNHKVKTVANWVQRTALKLNPGSKMGSGSNDGNVTMGA